MEPRLTQVVLEKRPKKGCLSSVTYSAGDFVHSCYIIILCLACFLRYRRYINHLLTYLLTYCVVWIEYFTRLLQRYGYGGATDVLSSTSPGSVISPIRAPCDVTYFYHPHYGIVACSRVCLTPPTAFCATNCPSKLLKMINVQKT